MEREIILRPQPMRDVLLLVETARAYGRGVVEGVARYADDHGPWFLSFEERGQADGLPKWLRHWHGDGIISRIANKRDMGRLLSLGKPLVQLYGGPESGLPHVCGDEAAVGKLAAEHFLDRGLQHLAFFCIDHAHWVERRRRAFEQKALGERGYRCHVFPAAVGDRSSLKRLHRIDYRRVIGWVRKLPKPCGVYCASDFYAANLLRACRVGGIVVPDQVAVLGVDNDPVFCGVGYPRLSSIDLRSDLIGYQAAALLEQLMSGARLANLGVCVKSECLITRQSTDISAIDDVDMARAIRLIREHACDQLAVEEIASAIGLSRRALEQRFRQTLNRSPKDEILRVRMERAESLLASSDIGVALVAKRCGFTSSEYFTRAFRNHTGTPPGAYRSQRRLGRSEQPH